MNGSGSAPTPRTARRAHEFPPRLQIVNIADCRCVANETRDNVGMELEIEHSIVKTNPTQVRYPPPGPRRRIALIAVGAIALLPMTVVASRLSVHSSGTAPVAFAEAAPDVSVAGEIEYATNPPASPQANTSTVGDCGLSCAPEVAALWQSVSAGASDLDARTVALAESIRSSLGAINDAVVAAASAMP